MTDAEAIWVKLDAFASRMEPPVKKAFLKDIQRVRAALTDEELVYIAQTGDLKPLLLKLDLSNYTFALHQSMIASIETAGVAGLPFEIGFNVMDPLAIRAMQTAELKLVSTLSTEIQAGVKTFLTAGLRNGVNPRVTAVDLRQIVGLTPKQTQSIANYRGLLTGGQKGQPYMEALSRATRDKRFDRAILNAITDKSPLKPDQVARQLERFETRLLNRRAETIARTETMDALYRAHMLRWQQAVDAGKIKESELRRFWHVAKDERVCPICAAIPGLNPEGVGFHEPFQTPEGELDGPTAHPNCRCVVFTRIVFEKNVLMFDLHKTALLLSGLRVAA